MKRHALAALLLVSNSHVASAMTTEACIDAHVDAQKRRAESKLLEARDALAQCGSAECPGVLRSECGAWLTEVSRQIPSVVPVVVTQGGADISSATLLLDGTSRSIPPGASTEVDPGPHTLKVVADGFQVATVPFTANVGGRDRRLEVTLVPIQRPAPVWPYFALGGGVALGVGAFAGLGALARSDEKELASCKPNCTDGEIDKVSREYLAANVGLAFAAASLAGAGAYFWFTRSSVSVRPETNGATVYYSKQF
jgi:hypothetical protein